MPSYYLVSREFENCDRFMKQNCMVKSMFSLLKPSNLALLGREGDIVYAGPGLTTEDLDRLREQAIDQGFQLVEGLKLKEEGRDEMNSFARYSNQLRDVYAQSLPSWMTFTSTEPPPSNPTASGEIVGIDESSFTESSFTISTDTISTDDPAGVPPTEATRQRFDTYLEERGRMEREYFQAVYQDMNRAMGDHQRIVSQAMFPPANGGQEENPLL